MARRKSAAGEIYGAVSAPTQPSKDLFPLFFFFSSISIPLFGEENTARWLPRGWITRTRSGWERRPCVSSLKIGMSGLNPSWTRNRNRVTLQSSRGKLARSLRECIYAMQLTATSVSAECNCRAVNYASRRDACVIRDRLPFNSRV